MAGEARQAIEQDGTTVIVPASCPYCGSERRPVKSGAIGVFECGTAVNFRDGGLSDQTSECKRLEIATLRARVAELEAAGGAIADMLHARPDMWSLAGFHERGIVRRLCDALNRAYEPSRDAALNTSAGPVNVSAGGEHER